ncbi:MAG: glycosyltransferase, partial [Candidatus Desantisbacteria bacterium]
QFMAMAKPVVSTTIGAEGLTVTHGEDILLADTPYEFAKEITGLLEDPELQKRIGKAGREMVTKYYSWDKIAECFQRICEKLLATGGK